MLKNVLGVQRLECFGPNPQCPLQGTFGPCTDTRGANPHIGSLWYHFERAGR